MCKETQWASFLARRVMNHLWLITHQSLLNISLLAGINLALRTLWCRHFWATFETNRIESTFLFYHTNHFESGECILETRGWPWAFIRWQDIFISTWSLQRSKTLWGEVRFYCWSLSRYDLVRWRFDQDADTFNPHRWKDTLSFPGAAGLRLVMWCHASYICSCLGWHESLACDRKPLQMVSGNQWKLSPNVTAKFLEATFCRQETIPGKGGWLGFNPDKAKASVESTAGRNSWANLLPKEFNTMEHVDMVLSCSIQVRWTSMIWGSAPSCSIGGKVMLIFGCVFFNKWYLFLSEGTPNNGVPKQLQRFGMIWSCLILQSPHFGGKTVGPLNVDWLVRLQRMWMKGQRTMPSCHLVRGSPLVETTEV